MSFMDILEIWYRADTAWNFVPSQQIKQICDVHFLLVMVLWSSFRKQKNLIFHWALFAHSRIYHVKAGFTWIMLKDRLHERCWCGHAKQYDYLMVSVTTTAFWAACGNICPHLRKYSLVLNIYIYFEVGVVQIWYLYSDRFTNSGLQ